MQSKGIGADGKYIFVDQNKDGDINASDYTYIGHALPRLTYGFYNELSYNRIKLSFLLRGVQGNDILNTPSMTNGYIKRMPGTNVLSEALTNGLLEDPTYSSYYIEDGSFLRLDNASLSYDVNTKKIGSIKRMKVHATVQNLFIVSRFSKLDPEVTISGITPGILETFYVPRPRTFSFGIDLSF